MAFNLASQSRRQAGSTFKLLTLTAAMEDGSARLGVERAAVADDPGPDLHERDGPLDMHNFADEESGTMSLLQATANGQHDLRPDRHQGFAPEKIVDVARAMGVQSPLVRAARSRSGRRASHRWT